MDSPAHDSQIDVGKRAFFVRRDMELARRIEQAYGPLRSLEDRLRELQFPLSDFSALYELVLAGQNKPPSPASIEAHILDVGGIEAATPILRLLMALFIGHAKYAELVRQEQELESDEDGEIAITPGGDVMDGISADPPLRAV